MSGCLPGVFWFGGLFKSDALFNLPFIMDPASSGKLDPTDDAAATLCDRYRVALRMQIPMGPCATGSESVTGEVANRGVDIGYAEGVFPMTIGTTFEGWQESQPTAVVGPGRRVNGGCIRVLTYKCCTFDRISGAMTIPAPTIWAWRTGGPSEIAEFRPHTSCSWSMLGQSNGDGGSVPRGWQWEGTTYTPSLPTAQDVKTLLEAAHETRWRDCVGPTFDLCLIAFIYAIYDSSAEAGAGCQQRRIGDGRVWLQGCIDTWSGAKC